MFHYIEKILSFQDLPHQSPPSSSNRDSNASANMANNGDNANNGGGQLGDLGRFL